MNSSGWDGYRDWTGRVVGSSAEKKTEEESSEELGKLI